jgi:site-specific DNA-methyltransferase (adenine-specific)
VQTKDKTMPTTNGRTPTKKHCDIKRNLKRRKNRKSNAKPEQTLWCCVGLHEWSRATKRGKTPHSCPEHDFEQAGGIPAATTRGKATKATKRATRSPSPSTTSRPSALHRLRRSLARAGVTLIHGDSSLEMAKMQESSIDAVICDPPYGLTDGHDLPQLLSKWLDGEEHESRKAGFMAKGWDSGVPSPALWREALRVLKPGGYCLAFGGSRTSHLTATALELAGFEVRDTLIWHYATGMPKTRYLGHALGHDSNSAVGSALSPSQEPIIVARKPLGRGLSLLRNIEAWGTGGLNIDAGRIGSAQTSAVGPAGRWPKNALFSHSAECRLVGIQDIACHAHSPAERVSGFGKFGGSTVIEEGKDHRPGHELAERWECMPSCPVAVLEAQRGDRPSRFFQALASHEPEELPIMRVLRHEEPGFLLAAKPSKAEREAGLTGGAFQARRGHRLAYGKREDVATYRLNTHMTVKPIAIMRWLIDLACPEGGTVLDPFNGSGSTGCAAVLAGREYVGIELDTEGEGYLDISAARIMHWASEGEETSDTAISEAPVIPLRRDLPGGTGPQQRVA